MGVQHYSKERLKREGNSQLVQDDIIPSELEKILQQTPGRWQFRHPSFQEFFAARTLAQKKNWMEIVTLRCRDERWEETLKFLSGMVSANEIFDIFINSVLPNLALRLLPSVFLF